MGEILKSWIQARLGVMIDLTPDVFGHYTRDGTLLAQILHSYDIINRYQLDTIVQTEDPALSRVNLKHLKFWLRFLGVECDDESITEISCGKGASSLRLFYKLYLSLEGKDRLHFITLQKEREKFVPTSKKFEVSVVSEDPPTYQPPDHPLCEKLVKGVAANQRFEFPSLLRQLRQKREKLQEPWEPYSIVHPVELCVIEPQRSIDESRIKESEELDRFARKHRVRSKKFEGYEEEEAHLEKERYEFEKGLRETAEDPEAGKAYVEELKRRAKCAAHIAALKSRMQKSLLWQLWERLAEKQDREFDEEIAGRTLNQSRYEKQMVSKLCEVREQKNAMAENQRIVENMTLKAAEMEHLASFELKKDLACKEQMDVDAECERMCELRRRLFEEKIQRMWEKHVKICQQVIEDLISIALNIGEYRRVNDGVVPLSLLSEWKTMFIKGQPITDQTFSKQIEEEFEEDPSGMIDEWCATYERIEARREAILEDYLEGNSPWDESTPMLGEEEQEIFELGRLVLGYVVHRLLNALYPRPPNRAQALMSRFKTAAILLGIANPELHESIRALLDTVGIQLVRMEDAINHCLQKYKDEMSDVEYIDLTVIAATNQTLRKQRGKKRSVRSSQSTRSAKSTEFSTEIPSSMETKSMRVENEGTKTSSRSARRRVDEKKSNTQDKETQTPRNIPFDDLDPVLTDTAYIGKWVYEFLTLGEPISNELATKVLIEYLQSVTDANGWALIDYPNTYEQMSRLELALTGSALPPDPKPLDFQDVTIEEILALPPRITFVDQEDPLAPKRRSRLVPDPIANRDTSATRPTFVTLFVRIAQKPRNFEADRSYEPVTNDADSMDKFYASRKIAHVLYYSSLDAEALKRLARLVIGDPLQAKPSDELFGEALKQLKPSRTVSSKAPVVRRLLLESEILEAEFDEDRLSIETRQSVHDYFRSDWVIDTFDQAAPAKPGEPHWRWIEFPLPAGLLENLGKLWERLENAYLDNAREMLYLKSLRVANVVPYREFVSRNMKEFIRRPDNKQDLLNEFHKAFNAIDPDARHDIDVKCELHRRVADFQATLWDICDKKKRESEEERRRLIADNWTVMEASILYNIYVGIVQGELDRFVDTMRLIEDYYLGMLKKPLPSSPPSKVILNRIEVDVGEPLRFEEPPFREPSRSEEERTPRKKDKSGTKTKSTGITPPPPAVDLNFLRKQIDGALIDQENELREAEDCVAFQGVLENVRYARGIVDALASAANELVKKERVASLKAGKVGFADSRDSVVAKMTSTGEEATQEWRYAISYEIDRIRIKLDSIIAVARMDFLFLLDTLQRTFHEIYNAIADRYWRETKSVNEMANVFCFAIEEGRMIENEMLLDGDTFVIRSNVFVMDIDLKKRESRVKEAMSGFRFRVANLARLAEIFKRVAPYGTISERAFVYILQDLTSHGHEEGESMLLPCCWYRLGVNDVSELVRYLFGSVDHVDWREFIVYAMDLPWPNVQDLLTVRERFRRQDHDLKETVTSCQYHRTSLWFLDCTLIDTDAYDLLHEDFEKAVEQLYEEELYRSSLDGDSVVFSMKKSSISVEPGSNPQELLRRSLAKELLCRMYAIDRHTVNYTALLLAFCKHEDPREGFAKALALALGNRVCVDPEEGERYLEQVYERKRLGLSWHQIICDEALEVTKSILDRLLERAMVFDSQEEMAEGNTISSVSYSSSTFSSNIEFEGEAVTLTDSLSSLVRRSKELVVYWIPLNLCLTVLAATLPWHVLQPEITGNCMTLRDRLTLVYKELKDEYLNGQKDIVLSHRLLNHDFIKRLLNSVTNYTTKNIGEEVRRLLQAREQM